MEGIKVNPQDPDIVEFEIDKGAGYIGCILCLKLLDTRIGLICAPFSYCWGLKLLRSQFCSVEEHRIIHKYGWMDRNERIVSLDRIQDVNIEKVCLGGMAGCRHSDCQT